jgi:hypothetical protein
MIIKKCIFIPVKDSFVKYYLLGFKLLRIRFSTVIVFA